MTHRSIRSRLAITSLAVALLATAPASAMPTDSQGTAAKDPRQQDMHASTVQAPQDLRGEAAAGSSSAQTPKEKAARTVQDARGEAAAGGGTGSAGKPSKPVLQGPPTWPAYPTPLPLPRPAPQPIVVDDSDDIGLDLPVALLILAGTLAVGGGLAVAATKGRPRVAH